MNYRENMLVEAMSLFYDKGTIHCKWHVGNGTSQHHNE